MPGKESKITGQEFVRNSSGEPEKGTDEIWAQLPQNYQRLKDWEYV